jgi:hypothetical protein
LARLIIIKGRETTMWEDDDSLWADYDEIDEQWADHDEADGTVGEYRDPETGEYHYIYGTK